MKIVIKLLIAALVANAGWRVGSAYLTHYKFQDASVEVAQFGATKSEDEIKAKVMELASQFDVPLAEDALMVSRAAEHTYIDATYVRQIEVVPTYKYPWTFKLHVDTMSYEGARLPSK